MEISNLGAADGLPPVDWDAVIEKLDAGSAPDPDAHNARTKWLATVNEDGSPHVTAVGAIWLDGAFWFQTGAGTRKARNVERRAALLGRPLDPRRRRRHRGRRRAGCRARHGRPHCEGVGGRWVASGTR